MPAFIEVLSGAGVSRDDGLFLALIFHPVRKLWTPVVMDAV